ncbi:DUF2970 domain-containing protein [Burkholderia alba]|uniref:DUF2970 domain-containing protein n=1 Tax=Burkholderia alba TaxID=2683677 RepID=UPI002B054799|nr:DUF2970 domain-containing protein [Burkholderia alba]
MNFLKMLRMVFWSFFGVRKGAAHRADLAAIKLPWLSLAIVMCVSVFGTSLFYLAKLAVAVAQ